MTTRLYRATEWSTCWKQIALPWFREVLEDSWKHHEPCSVLVPSPAWSHDLRGRLVQEGIGLVGTEILIPSSIRARLMNRYAPEFNLLDRGTGHFILASCARHFPGAVAKAVASDPASLWSEIEKLEFAGADIFSHTSHEVSAIVREASKQWSASRFLPAWEVDRLLLEKAVKQKTHRKILLFGFDARHWNLWNLLQAYVHSAESSTVCLINPTIPDEKSGILWHNTWEEFHGEIAECASEGESRKYEPVIQRFNGLDADIQSCEVALRVGRMTLHQAEIAVAETVRALAGSESSKIGIIVPKRGSLSREVAALLDQLKLPYFDGVAHFAPYPADMDSWRACVEWCRQGSVTEFLALLRQSPSLADHWGVSFEFVAGEADRCLSEYLLNDFSIFCAYLKEHPNTKSRSLGDILEGIPVLPANGMRSVYGKFLEKTFEVMGWKVYAKFLNDILARYENIPDISCHRDDFLKWMDDLISSRRMEKSKVGSHSFSRIQILLYEDAIGRDWDTLILTGLNQGVWPPQEDLSSWISEGDAAKINRLAFAQGKHGTGSEVLKNGKAYYLTPSECRRIQEGYVQSLLSGTRQNVILSWALFDEQEPDRELLPSDFASRIYQLFYGRPLDTQGVQRLVGATSGILGVGIGNKVTAPSEELIQTRVAYDARRNADAKFGVYEFALAVPPPKGLRIPCRNFERMTSSPAVVWLETVLGVSQVPEWTILGAWKKSRGIWCHHWLSRALNPSAIQDWVEMPNAGKLRTALEGEAGAFRERATDFLKSQGRALPRYWTCAWIETKRIAHDLAANVAAQQSVWKHAHVEWPLPKGTNYSTRDGGNLGLSGRIDLLLAKELPEEKDMIPPEVWILDYKTGKGASALKAKKVREGTGLQVALYALAVSTLGASSASASLVRFQEDLFPEIAVSEFGELEEVWKALARIESSGVMGWKPLGDPEFGYAEPLPLATLVPEDSILETKWKLTHGGLEA